MMTINSQRDTLNAAALDPHVSVVIEACAGSGKTWLLVSRILRLLLAGATPSSILAITFTRKAAQEMQERLMAWLEFLATASDAEAHTFLTQRAMTDAEIDTALPRARALFTEVAFASPAMAVSTFHGWFQQLISAAPMGEGIREATIADSEAALLDEAWLMLAESLNHAPESAAAQALSRLFAKWGLSSTRAVLWNFIKRRAEWRAYLSALMGGAYPMAMTSESATDEERMAASITAALEHWQQEWAVDLSRDPSDEWANNELVVAAIRGVIRAITTAPKMTDAALRWPPILEFALAMPTAAEKFLAIHEAFLTKENTPRQHQLKWAEKAGVADYFQRVCDDLKSVIDAQTNQEIFIYNRDALLAGSSLLTAYEKLKADQCTLDFADLEWRAFSLLTNSEHAETIQYRLDVRYRHILLDEFQDTNPIQWQCLTSWLDASVAADNRPTVFMVGDPKQAIYRFRRTDARLFQIAKEYFQREFTAKFFALNNTRRNAPKIVEFVNAVFNTDEFAGFRQHQSDNVHSLGAVAVLPKFVADVVAIETNVALRNPLTTPRNDLAEDRFTHEAASLAQAIENTVGRVLIEETIDGQVVQRPAQYRDIFVLFRRRSPLAAFEHALRGARIPYVGARPGGLMATLEVGDMVALLTFLSAPDDDLALAQVLRSPLFGASDQVLLALRFSAIDGTWWQRVQHLASLPDAQPVLQQADKKLRAWLLAMDHLPVHDLLDRVYHEADVIAAYSGIVPQSMCAGVVANLHAFMALALAVDSGRYPSLTRFLHELERYRTMPDQDAPDEGAVIDDGSVAEIAEADAGINAVRLMTIHAAKGLEAPIVFLLDADAVAAKTDAHTVLCDWQPEDAAPRHFSFWATKALQGNRRDAILADEAQVQLREQWNLLYVAVTRAKQYFIMSGTARTKWPDAVSWLEHAQKINAVANASATFPNAAMKVDRENRQQTSECESGVSQSGNSNEMAGEQFEPAPDMAIGKRWTPEFGDADNAQRELGVEVHRLLELRVASTYGVKNNNVQTNASAAAIAIVEKILGANALQKFFDPSQYLAAFNELEIGRHVQAENPGQTTTQNSLQRIDRLVEFADEVWVLDYKTGEVIEALQHQVQIKSYCDAVAFLYPAKTICGALIDADGVLTRVQ